MNANSLLALKVGFDILMLGEHHLGKSLVVLQYIHHHFIGNIDSLVEDLYLKVISSDDDYQEYLIYDALALQDRYSLLRKQQFHNCLCLMVVYSIVDRDLFEAVEDIVQHFNMVRNKAGLPSVPMVLVGNKSDLDDIRQVTEVEGSELAQRLGMSFFEVLAKTGDGIDDAFEPLIEYLRKNRHRRRSTKHTVATTMTDGPLTPGTLRFDVGILDGSSPESTDMQRGSQSSATSSNNHATPSPPPQSRSTGKAANSAKNPENHGCCVIT